MKRDYDRIVRCLALNPKGFTRNEITAIIAIPINRVTARGVQYDEVSGGAGHPDQRTKADISAARSGRHIKYDMAVELKSFG